MAVSGARPGGHVAVTWMLGGNVKARSAEGTSTPPFMGVKSACSPTTSQPSEGDGAPLTASVNSWPGAGSPEPWSHGVPKVDVSEWPSVAHVEERLSIRPSRSGSLELVAMSTYPS